jgi:hypothetical protein
MKLYTRTHVAILGIVLSLAALTAGVLVTALVIVPAAVQRQYSSVTVRGGQGVSATPVQFTASLAASLKPGDLTDDELNNIQIYDRANKAVVLPGGPAGRHRLRSHHRPGGTRHHELSRHQWGGQDQHHPRGRLDRGREDRGRGPRK